ncbi:hypothetical protein HK102_014042 [Quaeritorhiza haematococci]|nr:hypothetical protein HK102_014042 [Quaeritorhiza haematococci]
MAFVWNTDNYALGVATWLLIECMAQTFQAASTFKGRSKTILIWLVVASISPFISMLFRIDIIVRSSIPMHALALISLLLTHVSLLIVYIFRLRIFDAKGKGVQLVREDWVLIAACLIVLIIDVIHHNLEGFGWVPKGAFNIMAPIYYIIGTGFEFYVGVKLCLHLNNNSEESHIPEQQKAAYRADRRALLMTMIITMSIDVFMVLLAIIFAAVDNDEGNEVFLVLKRVSFCIKVRLAHNLFSRIKINHSRAASFTKTAQASKGMIPTKSTYVEKSASHNDSAVQQSEPVTTI